MLFACVAQNELDALLVVLLVQRFGVGLVAGSTPGRGAINSTRSTQPSIPPGETNRVPTGLAWVWRGAFTCVG